jgi:ectoine hydroxylase-related dioxygenase (phytanoyl-CoA dioxygenase family)
MNMLEPTSNRDPIVADLVARLESDGVAPLPKLLTDQQLRGMQTAFAARLKHLRWNDFDGYEQTELYRHMVHDVLLLDQGFVDLALHPIVKQVLNAYLGHKYELTEAKGWESLPTKRDFHGWHGDAWYEQHGATNIHAEVKLAMYLSDVESGAFNYIKGSHRKQHPRIVKERDLPTGEVTELLGPAGTAFLFDTSGIHRQGTPMLEARRAIFYNYHDSSVPLQREDIDYYRYHPLMLNAAFLGNLTSEDQRILGFGRKTHYQPAFQRIPKHKLLQRVSYSVFVGKLLLLDLPERIKAPLRSILGR